MKIYNITYCIKHFSCHEEGKQAILRLSKNKVEKGTFWQRERKYW
jgi:hypothetical protein